MSSAEIKKIRRLVEKGDLQLSEKKDGFYAKCTLPHGKSDWRMWVGALESKGWKHHDEGCTFFYKIRDRWLNKDRIRVLKELILAERLEGIKMNQDRLPLHWKDWIAENKEDGRLGCSDFNDTIEIKFEDGSEAKFKYAFAVEDEERQQLAVFTEHCGYHVFYLMGLEWKQLGGL